MTNQTTATPPDLSSLSFEDALRQLEQTVQQLERGDVPLEQSIALYERGVILRQQCEAKLAAAAARIEQIALAPDGTVTTIPFDAPAAAGGNGA